MGEFKGNNIIIEEKYLQGSSVQERKAQYENVSHEPDTKKSEDRLESGVVATFKIGLSAPPDNHQDGQNRAEQSQENEEMEVDTEINSTEIHRNPETSSIPTPIDTTPSTKSDELPLISFDDVEMPSMSSSDQFPSGETSSLDIERDSIMHHAKPSSSSEAVRESLQPPIKPCTLHPTKIPAETNPNTEQLTGAPGPKSNGQSRKSDYSQTARNYTPKSTIISKDLAKLLALSGGKSKAIFFHQVISPGAVEETPDKVSSIFYQDRWKKVASNLMSLWESSQTEWIKEHPRKIGEKVANKVRSYCSDAITSDFGILSGELIAHHVVATLPLIAEQALLLPTLLRSSPIPALESGRNSTLFVTKRLCCSLLANAFLSTFPQQRGSLPEINFHRLFNTGSSRERSKVKVEKVMCLLNYFRHMSDDTYQEQFGHHIISYERRCRNEFPKWEKLGKQLIRVVVEPRKKIQEAHGMLQVDFANKVIGGGVLNDGAIMEEILFVTCPELILSRLFTQPLEDNEVMVIRGAHQFSKYTGYSSTFEFEEPYVFTDVGLDNLGQLNTNVVAMDAHHFQGGPTMQFQKRFIDRELRKSYLGFIHNHNLPVATGNWGCGAFHGDTELKFLIQWVAATIAACSALHYHTAGDKHQAESINNIVTFIQSQNVSARKLYELMVKFYDVRNDYSSIFQFIKHKLSDKFRSPGGFESSL